MNHKQFTVIEGGREEMGQQALSAILRRDTATFDDLMSKMQPRPPVVSVISGGHEHGTDPRELPIPGQPSASKT